MKNRDMPAKPCNTSGIGTGYEPCVGLTKFEEAVMRFTAASIANPNDVVLNTWEPHEHVSYAVSLANALFDELEKQS